MIFTRNGRRTVYVSGYGFAEKTKQLSTRVIEFKGFLERDRLKRRPQPFCMTHFGDEKSPAPAEGRNESRGRRDR